MGGIHPCTQVGKDIKVAQNTTAVQRTPLTWTRKGERDKHNSQVILNTTTPLSPQLLFGAVKFIACRQNTKQAQRRTLTKMSPRHHKAPPCTRNRKVQSSSLSFSRKHSPVYLQKRCFIFRAAATVNKSEINLYEGNSSSTLVRTDSYKTLTYIHQIDVI